jgi:putative endonuclease
MKPWNVYIVRCADGSLYTGIAKDLERRMAEHNSDDTLGAKYTRGRRPVELVYNEHFDSRSEAARRESEIKRMKRDAKQNLITGT